MKNVPRLLRWVLGGLLLFEVVYVAAGIFLQSPSSEGRSGPKATSTGPRGL
jgi:hypothetical protein